MPADETGDTPPDYGMVSPISLPSNGRIPDPETGIASRAEYDGYFRLVRERPDLVRWTQSCLEVQRRMLADLDETDLSAEDRNDILAGCLVILHSTLEQWLAPSSVGEVAA